MSRLDSHRPTTEGELSCGADTHSAVEIARRCGEWLDREYESQQSLRHLLNEMSTQSPFSRGSGGELQSQMIHLLNEREESVRQQRCLRAEIGRLLNVETGDVHLSVLETRLPQRELQDLRERRLRMISQVEANRKWLRAVEMSLTRHNSCVADVLAHLLGKTSSPATYGADGRHATEMSDPALQAVS